MFYLEDDKEDEEVCEGSLSKTQDVYHDKSPPGILVSYISQCASSLPCLLNLDTTERRGDGTHKTKKLINVLRKMLRWILLTSKCYVEQKSLATYPASFTVPSFYCLYLLLFNKILFFLGKKWSCCFKLRIFKNYVSKIVYLVSHALRI